MTINNANDQYFKVKLNEINSLIEKKLIYVANEEYRNLIGYFSDERFKIEDEVVVEVYVSYAFFLLSLGDYAGFLEMLYKAQQFGYAISEIENILYDFFVEPNIEEFETNYLYNLRNINESNLNLNEVLTFAELPYWLISTGNEGEFYTYNKNTKCLGKKFSYVEENALNLNKKDNSVFADYIYDIEGNLGEVAFKLTSNSSKKNYFIIRSFEVFFSSLQGRKLEGSLFERLTLFFNPDEIKMYFLNSDSYLPRNIVSDKSLSEIEDTLNLIHNERLSKNASRNNILLSICIPSYNRGKRAYENVERLLNLKYDNEIEFVISNNGTINDTKEYYSKIRELADSRLTYFEFEENQGFAINACKVCEIANGRYILLISDEDSIDFNVLDNIMNDLRKYDGKISIYRTSTTKQSRVQTGEFKGGIDALRAFMLSSNYMSGIILNNGLLKKYEAIEYIRENLENVTCAAYPHMYWELLLLQYGVVKGTNQILIHEGLAEKTEVETVKQDSGKSIPYYATLESRLKQHEGFFKIFNDLELSNKEKSIYREMYIRLSMKTLYLVGLSINIFYKKEPNNNLNEIIKEAFEFCTDKRFLIGENKEIEEDTLTIRNYYLDLLNKI